MYELIFCIKLPQVNQLIWFHVVNRRFCTIFILPVADVVYHRSWKIISYTHSITNYALPITYNVACLMPCHQSHNVTNHTLCHQSHNISNHTVTPITRGRKSTNITDHTHYITNIALRHQWHDHQPRTLYHQSHNISHVLHDITRAILNSRVHWTVAPCHCDGDHTPGLDIRYVVFNDLGAVVSGRSIVLDDGDWCCS